jgi:hypothetical protein
MLTHAMVSLGSRWSLARASRLGVFSSNDSLTVFEPSRLRGSDCYDRTPFRANTG